MHLSFDGHLGWFHFLAIITNTIFSVGMQLSLWGPVFNSLGYLLKSGIAESYSSFIFYFLRYSHTVFHSSCTILQSHHQGWSKGSSFSTYPPVFVSFLFCLIASVLMALRWYFIVLWVCISLEWFCVIMSIFICLPFVYHIWKNVFSSPLLIFKLRFFAAVVEIVVLIPQLVKNLLAIWESWVQTLGWEDPLEKGKATHSSILA